MKRMLVIALGLFFCVSFFSCGDKQVKDTKDTSGQASSNTGQATGYATIFDNDTALARDRAIDDAKLKLVRQILGETIQGKELMKDFELVESIIEAKSVGLVKRDKIIKQWQEGSEYFVTIEGTVEPTAVEDAIADILKTYGRPKFMVLIGETFEGKSNTPGFTETELIIQEIMGNSGFDFVDAAMTQKLMQNNRTSMTNAMNGKVGDQEQQLLLNDLGAEVLIIGTAETNDQSGAMQQYSANMKSKQAIIRLKAIDVYTGAIIATTSKNAPGAHIDSATASKKAIEGALKLILGSTDSDTRKFKMGPFLDAITGKFIKAAGARQITLLISGLDYNGLTDFRNNVSNRIRGVSSVTAKGQAGTASRVEIIFAGKTNDFADELIAKASNIGLEIKVTESYPNKLVITAKKK
ncbi:MAG: DUF6175 family protein [Spirochaetia bacterium]|jgi:hypothetical protein|nr:DUF6175 family protein [Spirochaetia bacterium]